MKVGELRNLKEEIGNPVDRNGKTCAFKYKHYEIFAEEKVTGEVYEIIRIYDNKIRKYVDEIKD